MNHNIFDSTIRKYNLKHHEQHGEINSIPLRKYSKKPLISVEVNTMLRHGLKKVINLELL